LVNFLSLALLNDGDRHALCVKMLLCREKANMVLQHAAKPVEAAGIPLLTIADESSNSTQ
jgi:hypothetical protein